MRSVGHEHQAIASELPGHGQKLFAGPFDEVRLLIPTDLDKRQVGEPSVCELPDAFQVSIHIGAARDLPGDIILGDHSRGCCESRGAWKLGVDLPST